MDNDTSAQGGDIGTAVISRLIDQASTNKRLELQVLKVNARAKKLYERLGFKTTGEKELHYQMVFTWISIFYKLLNLLAG